MPRLVLLDLGIVLRSACAQQDALLLLTGRGTAQGLVAGLDSGAWYYLAKPFANGGPLARMRASRRRREFARAPCA